MQALPSKTNNKFSKSTLYVVKIYLAIIFMKKILSLLIVVLFFISCSDDNDPKQPEIVVSGRLSGYDYMPIDYEKYISLSRRHIDDIRIIQTCVTHYSGKKQCSTYEIDMKNETIKEVK